MQSSKTSSPDSSREKLCRHLVRAMRDAIRDALAELNQADSDITRAVHECRKRLKIARALLDLACTDPSGKSRNRVVLELREAGRILAKIRGDAAMIECISTLAGREQDDDVRALYGRLLEYCSASYQKMCLTDSGARPIIQEAARRIRKVLQTRDKSLNRELKTSLVLKRGAKACRRACNGMIVARQRMTPETIHEWRKKTKILRYQQEYLFGKVSPAQALFPDQLHHLTDFLGNAHDAALLIDLLRANRELPLSNTERTQMGVAATRHYRECSERAFALGEDLFGAPADRYIEHLTEE